MPIAGLLLLPASLPFLFQKCFFNKLLFLVRFGGFGDCLCQFLRNDFRAPKTIEHLFPRRLNRWQEKLIKELGRDETCGVLSVLALIFVLRFCGRIVDSNRFFAPGLKDNVPEKDFPKFEEIRQFFFLYETTGSNMTLAFRDVIGCHQIDRCYDKRSHIHLNEMDVHPWLFSECVCPFKC